MSYISIGLVFKGENIDEKIKVLEKLIDDITIDKKIKSYKYSKDNNGYKWVEVKRYNKIPTLDKFTQFATNYHTKIKLRTVCILQLDLYVSLRIINEEEYYGILIDIEENDIQSLGYEETENRIISYLTKMSSFLKYDYAFCDHEGEVEYSPEEIHDKKDSYSILLINNNDKIELRKNNWLIDGFSQRWFRGC